MIFTKARRIVRTGFVNYWRNSFLSFAAIVVITLSLCSFGLLIFGSAFFHTLLTEVKNKVDITVYFSLAAAPEDITTLQEELRKLPEVSSTSYISREQALANFTAKWQNNTLLMQGLQEIGSNPFPASITIKAKEPGQYAGIAEYLQDKNPSDANGTPIITKVNYEQNKLVIDRLSKIIPTIEQAGLTVAVLFVLVAMIVVWNTIRLVIYTARDEISVMKLVGASNTYVRGPFVVSGIMYGITSGLLTLLLMWSFAYWGDNLILRVAGVDVASNFELVVNVLSGYFFRNLPQIIVIIMGSGVILGGISSYIAARRYLHV